MKLQSSGLRASALGKATDEALLVRIAQHRPGGIVELQITAAGVIESTNGGPIGFCQIVKERIEIGIDIFADGGAALASHSFGLRLPSWVQVAGASGPITPDGDSGLRVRGPMHAQSCSILTLRSCKPGYPCL